MSFVKKHPNITATLFGIVLCFVLLLFAEMSLRVVDIFSKDDNAHQIDKNYAEGYWHKDEFKIPWVNEGRHRSFSQYEDTGENIYDVFYTVDEFSRRITPVTNGEARDKYILFLGGSFMYGEGVKDHETLPSRVAALAMEYMPYNYAFHGLGPFDLLAKLENYDLRGQIKEKDGMLIYLFLDHHVNRVIGSMSALRWKGEHPYYALDRQGQFVRRGNFNSAHPVSAFLYKVMRKSRILKMLKVGDFPRINNAHIRLTAEVIEAMKNRYIQQFGNDRFYVFIKGDTRIGKQLADELNDRQITNFDIQSIFSDGKPEYKIAEGDGHPSALAHRMMAEKIVQDLHLR